MMTLPFFLQPTSVRQKELITRRTQYQFGHRQPVAIFVRLLDLHQRAELRRAQPVHDAVLNVVIDGLGSFPVRTIVMDERWLHIEHVDHRRHDGNHA